MKELQRMFGENKLLLRASGASFVKVHSIQYHKTIMHNIPKP